MPSKMPDLDDYEEPFPSELKALIDEIQSAGADRNLVEANKLRVQVALTAKQTAVSAFVSDQAERRSREDAKSRKKAAAAELAAAASRAASADQIAKSLTRATWVLAAATAALVVATVVSIVFAASDHANAPAAPDPSPTVIATPTP